MTKQLHLPGVPVPQRPAPEPQIGMDFAVTDAPWPMPAARPWVPMPRELSLKEKWRLAAQRRVGE